MRVGTVCYATEQGIGYLPKWFYDQGVITDVVIFRHGSRGTHTEWYPDAGVINTRPFEFHDLVRKMVDAVDVMLFFETPFDWGFLNYCRERGVRTVIVPMYECTPENVPVQPDRWVCPSLLDCLYFPGSPFLQVPVPPKVKWERRERAVRWLHNGGNLGLRGHKGTLEILRAIPHVKSPDFRITVRAQDRPTFDRIIRQAPPDSRVILERGERPYEDLFRDHDVFIMAEKYNGLSLPLMEARASGMLVMTSDRFPTNVWLPREPLIPVYSYSKQRVSGAFKVYDEAEVRPEDIARTIDDWFGASIGGYSDGGREWGEANSWDRLRDRWLEVLS